jgi:hypothetical protein
MSLVGNAANTANIDTAVAGIAWVDRIEATREW